MGLLVVVLLLAVAAYLIFNRIPRAQPQPEAEPTESSLQVDYRKAESLLTPAERSFLGVLEQATQGRYRILAKVRLADLILPQKGLDRSSWKRAFNRIVSKHVDFVLVDPNTTEPLISIEVDDKSHQEPDRQQRDDFVEKALQSAQLRLVRIPVRMGYSLEEIRSLLGIAQPETKHDTTLGFTPLPTTTQPTKTSISAPPQDSTAPNCPKCSAVMVKRQAKSGQHSGKWFWACSRFPECRGVVAIPDG